MLLGLLLGFGVKLPTVPLHNWLPDAHVEAPTEGSVMLAGIQLKMGAYGLLRIMIPTLPDAVQRYAWLLLALALVSLVYGALAALARAIHEAGLVVHSAHIATYGERAIDVFYLADADGRKLGKAAIDALRPALLAAAAA